MGRSRLLAWVHRGEEAALIVLLATLILVGAAPIALRNIGAVVPAWSEEAARLLVLWVAMFGAMVAARGANHIAIDVLAKFLPPRAAAGLRVITSLFAAGVSGLVAWYCVKFVRIEWDFGSEVLEGVPAWMVEMVLPVGFTVIALRYGIAAVAAFRAVAAPAGEEG